MKQALPKKPLKRVRAHVLRLVVIHFGCSLAVGSALAQASQEELSDLSGRVEYAFYAGDATALQQALTSLEKLSVVDAQRETWLSELRFARWKLTQLQSVNDQEMAGRTADACVDSLSAKASAEQQAFAAACLTLLEKVRPLRTLWYRNERETRMKQALLLSPKNPQVQFVSAWIQVEREPNAAESYAALQSLVARFAEVDAQMPQADRGYAEALYLLGKMEFARRNLLAARNALERATVLAPDYRAAQELLKQVSVN